MSAESLKADGPLFQKRLPTDYTADKDMLIINADDWGMWRKTTDSILSCYNWSNNRKTVRCQGLQAKKR